MASIKPRRIIGRFSAKPSGRPRALTGEELCSVQSMYAFFMSRTFQIYGRRWKGLPALKAAQIVGCIATALNVSERVVVDAVRRRGAYASGGMEKAELDYQVLLLEVDFLKDELKQIKGDR